MILDILGDILDFNANHAATSLLVFIVVFLTLHLLLLKPVGLPPGPLFTLPILGDLPLLVGRGIR